MTGCGSSETTSLRVFCEPTCGPNPCLVLSPNPTKEKSFTLSLDALKFKEGDTKKMQTNIATQPMAKVEIINQNGMAVQSFYTNKRENFINMKKFPVGRYFVRVTNQKNNTFTESIIVK